MAFATSEPRKLAGRAGAAAKHKHPDADDLRRELAEVRLAEHIRKVVASAPPLTQAQRDRLAGLLRPAPDAVSA